MNHTHTSEHCKQLKSQLSGFIDGDLDDAICQEIQKHLENCENCKIVVDTLKKTVTLYRESPAETVPPAAHDRLIKVLDLEAIQKGNK